MVLRQLNNKMSSDQPVKKKLKITDQDEETTQEKNRSISEKDEIDFKLTTSILETSNTQLETPNQSSLAISLQSKGKSDEIDFKLGILNAQQTSNQGHSLPNNEPESQVRTSNPSSLKPSCQAKDNGDEIDFKLGTSNLTNLGHPLPNKNMNKVDLQLGTSNLSSLGLSLPTNLEQKTYSESDELQRMCNLRNQVITNSNAINPNHCSPSTSSNICKFVESIPTSALSNALSNIVEDPFNVNSSKSVAERRIDTVTYQNVNCDNYELVIFENTLLTDCLCGINEEVLQKILDQENAQFSHSEHMPISSWNRLRIIQFLSNLQLLFDVYLKQNNRGIVCGKILDICTYLTRNETKFFEEIIELEQLNDNIVSNLSVKVLASFFIIAKTHVETNWVTVIVNSLTSDSNRTISFSIDIIKRILDWKDMDIHILEEDETMENVQSSPSNENCTKVTLTDHDTFDTSPIKSIVIQQLEEKWPQLLESIEQRFTEDLSPTNQSCIINFLSLWENIISVRANLSVIDTKSFYTHLDKFVYRLNVNLPSPIWRQLLSLFNELLCYGSTLALQDMLPEETCILAHLIVRCVKDYRLLDALPLKRNCTVNSFIGSTHVGITGIDKTLLQKKVLLVLKSIAITVKETRSDSSDSSVGSDDFDFNQDMQLIERSIRDVLKKLDLFLKNSLDYHPESQFTKIIIHLFSDQDDYMIESMVCMLDITAGICYRNSVFPDLVSMLNPSNTFIEFLKAVCYDSNVLLDYLVSNETCFLLYLLRFLKYVRKNWSNFVHSCEMAMEGNSMRLDNVELDNVMAVLIRLRLQINRLVSKQRFPYNIGPVVRLLENCESLYEGNDLS